MERLPEDTVAAILFRLPSKSLLRSGAVCKDWRRITAAPHFLAARAPPPLSIIVCTDLERAPWPHLALDAVPVFSSFEDGGACRYRLIRYPNAPLCVQPHCLLLASCDGVLLFGTGSGGYLLCNPVTRQWVELPRLPDEYGKELNAEYAFYFHRPSGEFRLLCCSLSRRVWYVVTASTGRGGSAEPRHLEAANDPSLITQFIDSLFMTTATPVALHGNLHWQLVGLPGTDETRIVVFDTVSETFRHMPGPESGPPNRMKLFQMGGLLAAADFGEEEHVDLWVLEDYGGAGRWVRRHRVASPWKHGKGRPRGRSGMQSMAAAADSEGNVVILGNSKGLAVYDTRRRGEAVGRSVGSVTRREFVSRHVFQGSMVQHLCFGPPPNADSLFIYS